MSSNKNMDPNFREFQHYLEQTGVLCMLKHIFFNLYDDRGTDDAIEYFMSYLGEKGNQAEIEAADVRIAELQAKLEQFENKTPNTQG